MNNNYIFYRIDKVSTQYVFLYGCLQKEMYGEEKYFSKNAIYLNDNFLQILKKMKEYDKILNRKSFFTKEEFSNIEMNKFDKIEFYKFKLGNEDEVIMDVMNHILLKEIIS